MRVLRQAQCGCFRQTETCLLTRLSGRAGLECSGSVGSWRGGYVGFFVLVGVSLVIVLFIVIVLGKQTQNLSFAQ